MTRTHWHWARPTSSEASSQGNDGSDEVFDFEFYTAALARHTKIPVSTLRGIEPGVLVSSEINNEVSLATIASDIVGIAMCDSWVDENGNNWVKVLPFKR